MIYTLKPIQRRLLHITTIYYMHCRNYKREPLQIHHNPKQGFYSFFHLAERQWQSDICITYILKKLTQTWLIVRFCKRLVDLLTTET